MKCYKCGKELSPSGPGFRIQLLFPDYPGEGYVCVGCLPQEEQPGMIDKLHHIRDSLKGED